MSDSDLDFLSFVSRWSEDWRLKRNLMTFSSRHHMTISSPYNHHYHDTMLSYHHIGSKSWCNQEEGERRGRGNLRHSGTKGGQKTDWRRGVAIDFYQTFTFSSYFIMLERERRRIFMQVWGWGEKTTRTLKTDTRSHSDQIWWLLIVGWSYLLSSVYLTQKSQLVVSVIYQCVVNLQFILGEACQERTRGGEEEE